MNNSAQCDECEAILEQFKDGWVEIRELLKDQCRYAASAGTGDQLDGLLNMYQFHFQPELKLPEPKYPRIADAFRRMVEHQTRTGHNVLFRR
jgi:hypothetical protein